MQPPDNQARYKPSTSSPFRMIFIIVAIVLVCFVAWGITSRVHHNHKLKKQTQKTSTLIVNVIHPDMLTSGSDIVLPGNVRAWHEASLSARVSGYLKAWHKDIGDHVKAGDLLAEIDTPETDRQLQQAEADLVLAIANSQLAQITANRWLQVVGTHAVSQQETDEKVADAKAKAATVLSQTAARDRLRELESFKRIIAPFDGVVTARTTDIGALIAQGGGELYHIVTINRLRVYVSVPEIYTTSLSEGTVAELRFTEHPSEKFDAKLLSTSRSIDPTTRTLLAQFVLDNAEGTLFPGGFAEVHLKSSQGHPTLRLPVNAFLFQDEGLQVAVVGPDKKIVLQKVTPGRDFGQSLEVVAGLAPDAEVVLNPPDSLYQGEIVRIAPIAKQDGGMQEQEAKDSKSDKDQKENKDKKIDKSKSGDKDQKNEVKPEGDDSKNDKDKGSSKASDGQTQGGIQTDPSLQDENTRSFGSSPQQKPQSSDDQNTKDDKQ